MKSGMPLAAYLGCAISTEFSGFGRGEGLVLKTPDSPYVLAGREAFWVKVCY